MRAIGQRARSGRIILRDVSLAVGYGELVAIIGGSGSGKTTLLDAMSGLRPPATGTVLRDPRAPGGKRHIGYVPDAETIHPVIPLGRALRYTAALRGASVHDGAVGEALSVAALRGKEDVLVSDLDPGERKRAAIAAELLSPPALLFLEEPTVGLDPAQGAEVMRLLHRLRDAGTTVVLTTPNPLNAVRCDKVAVLATGGHLAFFGTPAAACDYFAADSLDEIYERLAGLGDPAAAWARRFFRVSGATSGFLSYQADPAHPGPARLVPDSAGPHSAGRLSAVHLSGGVALSDPGQLNGSPAPVAVATEPVAATLPERGSRPVPGASVTVRAARAARQFTVLVTRSADVIRHDRRARLLLAWAPLAVVMTLLLLLLSGALGPAGTTDAFSWTLLGGIVTGLSYGLPQVHREIGVLRADRFAGLSASAYVLARAVLLLPVLAVVDAIAALVPAVAGRLPGGYGPSFLSLALASAVAFALALVLSAVASAQPRSLRAPAAPVIPLAPLAAAAFTLLNRQFWGDWLVLALIAAALTIFATSLIARIAPEKREHGW